MDTTPLPAVAPQVKSESMLTQPNEPQPSASSPQPDPSVTPPETASPGLTPQGTAHAGVNQGVKPMNIAQAPSEVSPMAEDSPEQGGDGLEQSLPPGEQVVTRHINLSPEALQVLRDHSAFLQQQGKHLTSVSQSKSLSNLQHHMTVLKLQACLARCHVCKLCTSWQVL